MPVVSPPSALSCRRAPLSCRRAPLACRAPLAVLLASALLPGCLGERGGTPGVNAGENQDKPGEDRDSSDAIVRDDVALPLTSLLGRAPQDVEAMLGDPPGKGFAKESCVRFAPKRIFFGCKFVSQTYADKTGTFGSVTVDYEDGLSARVAFNGLPGAGPLTWEEALEIVGLELPRAPAIDSPADGVTLWSWYNGAARLFIGDKQYRVEASVVRDDRSRAKVDVILNHPLSPEQEAKILEVKPKRANTAPGGAPPADATH